MDVGNDPELSYLEAITEDIIFDLTVLARSSKVSVYRVKKYKENSDISVNDIAEAGCRLCVLDKVRQDGPDLSLDMTF